MSTRPLRLVHITGCLDMGGQEKLLVEFARHADRRRFDLHFLSLERAGALAREIEAEGWPVTSLNVSPGFHPALAFRIAHWLRRRRIDVVHTHNNRPLIYGAAGARMAGVRRVIHTRHGQNFGNKRRQVLLANWAGRLVDRFVCVSDDAARMTVEQGLSARRVWTIWNGIDTRRFAFAGPRSDGPAVIVARLSPEKDIETLLRASAQVVRQDPTFRLEIAGDGACLSSLQALTRESGLDEHVKFHGMVSDVPALLGRASFYVLSSISEGISLTLLEAMVRGLPVVATQVGGTAEAVVGGETGLLVPPRDPAALAAAILTLRRDAVLGRRLGKAGRARVEEHFDVRRMVERYESLYSVSRSPWASALPPLAQGERLNV